MDIGLPAGKKKKRVSNVTIKVSNAFAAAQLDYFHVTFFSKRSKKCYKLLKIQLHIVNCADADRKVLKTICEAATMFLSRKRSVYVLFFCLFFLSLMTNVFMTISQNVLFERLFSQISQHQSYLKLFLSIEN